MTLTALRADNDSHFHIHSSYFKLFHWSVWDKNLFADCHTSHSCEPNSPGYNNHPASPYFKTISSGVLHSSIFQLAISSGVLCPYKQHPQHRFQFYFNLYFIPEYFIVVYSVQLFQSHSLDSKGFPSLHPCPTRTSLRREE